MTTNATPLSTVSMILSLSFLSCANPIFSCLVKVGLGTFPFLSSQLMSDLSSMASSFNLGHIDSIAVIYSTLGMLLGDMA